jgi:hypothetical protein
MPLSRKVVLFLPPYSGKLLGAPLGLLSLAGSLRAAGFEPRIIDGALDPDYRRRIAEEIQDCICFGVSLLTGPMILDAIEVSRMVKSARPDLTVIFGGWHPSLESGQTLREDFVDVVVRHQGEATLVEIVLRLEAGKPLDLVSGCWFNAKPNRPNPDRPAPAYLIYRPLDLSTLMPTRRASESEARDQHRLSVYLQLCTDMVFYNRRSGTMRGGHGDDGAGVALPLTNLLQFQPRLTYHVQSPAKAFATPVFVFGGLPSFRKSPLPNDRRGSQAAQRRC